MSVARVRGNWNWLADGSGEEEKSENFSFYSAIYVRVRWTATDEEKCCCSRWKSRHHFHTFFCWLAAVYMNSCVIQTQIASLFSLTSVDYMYVLCGKVNIFPIRRHEKNVDREGKKSPSLKNVIFFASDSNGIRKWRKTEEKSFF